MVFKSGQNHERATRLTPLPLSSSAAPSDPAPSLSLANGSEPLIGTPKRYGGDPESCNAFLTNFSLGLLDSVLPVGGGHSQSVVWVSPLVQWAGGAQKPRLGVLLVS